MENEGSAERPPVPLDDRGTPRTKPSVLLAGATGTIGRAVAAELLGRGHAVTCLLRRNPGDLPAGADVRTELPGGARFGAVVSCVASRTGVAADAWAVDHGVNMAILDAARACGAGRFLLLSAICVQRPELAFQHAKLAFEKTLRESGLDWTIVRPTAFFKSLSGQVARVRAGRPFLMFGDGTDTACKPIGDRDLARFIVDALTDPDTHGRILPIGGPGPAITPADQVALLSDLLGRPILTRRVPPRLMDGIVAALTLGAKAIPALGAKAELARIGRYYARESMLVWDTATGAFDAGATPEYGTETLRDHYAALLAGTRGHDGGAQQVFRPPKGGGTGP